MSQPAPYAGHSCQPVNPVKARAVNGGAGSYRKGNGKAVRIRAKLPWKPALFREKEEEVKKKQKEKQKKLERRKR